MKTTEGFVRKMKTQYTMRERSLPHSHRFMLLAALMLMLLAAGNTLPALAHSSKQGQAGTSFIFTVAGDYSQTTHTTANLNYIGGSSGASFNLAIGDFNYNPNVSTDAWSNYVKGLLPPLFPFEIVGGNEDSKQINTYIADLPDHLGNFSGTYGKQYYFDYPLSTPPLARFILVSPGGVVSGYNYKKGSADYNWVSSTIDSARTAGIPWVIVAMHEPCIRVGNTKGNPKCPSDGSALMNLLISKKVDLILTGHAHSYQASKQLAFNGTTCKSIQLNAYNSNCVVNATTSLTKGAGSVIVISGTGGSDPLSTLNNADPEAGYFRSWMGINANETFGVSQFTVSATQLSMQFVGTSGGNFSDSFTI